VNLRMTSVNLMKSYILRKRFVRLSVAIEHK
jgi:hypothetical protein